jgi:hypothetical protein
MNTGKQVKIDPRVAKRLEKLRELPARRPEDAIRSRVCFLAELDDLPSLNPRPTKRKE